MGIPGLLKEIGKGERIALSKLAVEFLERQRRPLRIAIDIAIWQFQNQAGQGGQNPALRTFYYRLVRLLALPIQPLFVYDGPTKPLAKRGKVVSRYGTAGVHNELSKKLLRLFRFPYRTAPGEAEAECALLQRENIVDAVMSEDVDVLMWGSTVTLRDWSQEGTRGNKAPTHVNVLRAGEIAAKSTLDPDGMILVAILSGGDYAPDGIPGFGPGLACEIAKAKFGTELLEAVSKEDTNGLAEWKERLQYELETNESGYFKTKHKTAKLPPDFPDRQLLRYYTHPAVSTPADLQGLREELSALWDGDLDISELRDFVAQTFNWQCRGGAYKLVRSLAPALLARRLLRKGDTTVTSSDAISDRRMHFVSDGMPELRVAVIPANIVGLNLEEEEANIDSDAAQEVVAAADEDLDAVADLIEENEQQEASRAISRQRKKSPWDPQKPEKIWIPETMVKLGIPRLVEEWEQRQRDLVSDPKSFIANKPRKTKTFTMGTQQTQTINAYFDTSKIRTIEKKRAAVPVSPPKRVIDGSRSFHGMLDTGMPSTPPRRGVRSIVAGPISPLDTSVNPFSIAIQASPSRAKTSTSEQNVSERNHPFPVDRRDPSAEHIRRKRTPIQKSKTLPCTFEEGMEPSVITITSSPFLSTSPPTARPRLDTSETVNTAAAAQATSKTGFRETRDFPPPLTNIVKTHHHSLQPTKSSGTTTTTIIAPSNYQSSRGQPPMKKKTGTKSTTVLLTEIFVPRSQRPPLQTNTSTTPSPSFSPFLPPTRPKPSHIHIQPQTTKTRTQKTTTTTRHPATNPKTQRKTVLPRSSLPGTWKEVPNYTNSDDDDDANVDLDLDLEQDQQPNPKRQAAAGAAAIKVSTTATSKSTSSHQTTIITSNQPHNLAQVVVDSGLQGSSGEDGMDGMDGTVLVKSGRRPCIGTKERATTSGRGRVVSVVDMVDL